MAVINEDEQDASQGQVQPNGGTGNSQPTTGPVAVPGGGGIGSSVTSGATNPGGGANSSTSAPSVSAAQQSQNGQGFTDVAAYLNANQSGAGQLGSSVANNLSNQYNTLNNNINQSNTAFNSSVNSGYTPENQQLISQASANPTSFVSDTTNPNNVSNFQSQLNDTYTGPTAWNDTTNTAGTVTPGYGSLQGQVAEGQQQAGLINSQGGQQELVSQVESNPTAGISGLDALLLGGSAPAVQQVQTAAAPFNTLTPTLNNLNTANTTNVANAQTAAGQTASDALNAFTGAAGTNSQLTNAINNQVQAAQQAATGNNTAASTLLAQLASGTAQNLSAQQLADLGISQDQYNTLQGLTQILNNPSGAGAGKQYNVNGNAISTTAAPQTVNLTPFYNPINTGMINAATVATPQQYQELSAINQLIGGNNTTGVPINSNDASYAGTAPTSSNFEYNQALSQLENMLTGDYATPPVPGPSAPGATIQSTINNLTDKLNSNPATAIASLPVTVTANVVNSIVNAFCFHENSPIMMLYGGTKPINKIELGDETLGGTVLSIKVAYAEDMYWYSGVLVTGLHAVLDDNGWMRVKDTEIAVLFPGRFKVYNLVTSAHRIWVGGIEFTDEYETDNYEMLDLNESIEVLNESL